MIKSNSLSKNILDIPWNIHEMDEGEYNLQYLHKEGFLVLDKILGQNIEMCDLLYETADNIYLIHVKEGFDAKIRDLTNQISISANRLWSDLKSDFKFVDEVYEAYARSQNMVSDISNEDFRNKFKKDIVYVMAFNSQLTNKRVSQDIRSFKSNIAKFSLIQCVRDMPTNNYPLKVFEIDNGY